MIVGLSFSITIEVSESSTIVWVTNFVGHTMADDSVSFVGHTMADDLVIFVGHTMTDDYVIFVGLTMTDDAVFFVGLTIVVGNIVIIGDEISSSLGDEKSYFRRPFVL